VAPTNEHGGKKRVKISLVALSSAAVLSVYGAGYVRTRAAAERFAEEPVRRRPEVPAVIQAVPPAAAAGSAVPAGAPAEVSRISTGPAQAPATAPGNAVSTGVAIKAAGTITPTTAPASESPTVAPPAAPPPEADAAPAPSLAAAATTPLAVAAIPTSDHAATLAPPPPSTQYKDGTYTGWGTSRHGDIQASVIIAGGRIASARISLCYTRYSCSVIDPLPPQVAIRQSPEVDYVSGATQSANAFYYAVIEALSKAK
jgi:uncharacterized protein with FMN-binding domain